MPLESEGSGPAETQHDVAPKTHKAASSHVQPAQGSRRARALLAVTSVFVIAAVAAGYWLVFLPWRERAAEQARTEKLARQDAQWKAACKKDASEAYAKFIEANPDAPVLGQAKARLAESQAWDAAERQSTIQAYADFLEAHRDTSRAPVARRRIKELSVRRAVEAATGLSPEVKQLFETSAALPRGDLRIGALTADQQQAALDVLVEAARLAGGENCIGFPDIQPMGPGQRLPDDSADIGVDSDSSIRTGTHQVKLGGFISAPSGLLSEGLMIGKGEYVVGTAARRCPFTGRLTVSRSPTGMPLLSTELPGERLIFGNPLGGLNVRIPAGAGTIYRFRGMTFEFFPQYVIQGDEKEPLCFVLLSKGGLVYLCGRGTVTTPKKAKIQLPPSEP